MCLSNSDYTCYQITEGKLKCSSAGRCYCTADDAGWGSNSLCKRCISGDYYYLDNCFKFSSSQATSNSDAETNCNRISTSGTLAVLSLTTRKTFILNLMTTKNLLNSCYVGLYNINSGWTWNDHVSINSGISSGWCSPANDATKNCAVYAWSGSKFCLENKDCSNGERYICQYDAN